MQFKKALITTLMSAAIGTSGVAFAAEKPPVNPFGLVYRGALTANQPGAVNMQTVRYTQIETGIEIAANVYTPAHFDPSKSYPAIVVAHPNGGVKEQVAGLYAQRLAEHGYIAIAADAAFQGASNGIPRNVDKPFYRENDIHAMADFISQFKGVDAKRIGALGICGGGGYTFKAAQGDKRLKAVATVSLFNTGLIRREGMAGSQISTLQERLQKAAAARAKLIATGQVDYEADADLKGTTSEQVAQMPSGLYRDGAEYYGITHYHPNSSPRYTTESLIDLIEFDARNQAELINQPLLMIAGSAADTLYMTEQAFAQATSAKNKELFVIPGATHIQTYWKPEYVQQAVDKLTDFYGKNL